MQNFITWLAATPLSLSIQTTSWAIPTIQTIHILAVCVLFGAVVASTLRVAGWVFAEVPLAAIAARFAPWIWGALALLAMTGLTLVIAEPARELLSVSFWVKMILLGVGASFVLVLQSRLARMPDASPGRIEALRPIAFTTLGVWVCVMFLGPFIAYDPIIFGWLY
jgi:hypothetical protein